MGLSELSRSRLQFHCRWLVLKTRCLAVAEVSRKVAARWVCGVSDYEAEDIVKLRSIDSDSPNKLLRFGTQLPASVRLDCFDRQLTEAELFEVFENPGIDPVIL